MGRNLILSFVLIISFTSLIHAENCKLNIKPNSIWVMAGDSITAQKLHSNYIEAFFRTKYPKLNIQFRNSGISGNRAIDVLNRFDKDIAVFNPTIVSVELGMNDVWNGDDPSLYVKQIRELVHKIKEIGAQPILISSSPVNDGSIMGKWESDQCRRLHQYTQALKQIGREEKVLVVDQYHKLINIWGGNRPAEEMYFIAQKIQVLTRNSELPGVKHLQRFKNEWDRANVKPIFLGGDPVHPGPVGQYMMAAVILDALDVDRTLSSAEIKADGTVVTQKKCKILNITPTETGIRFTRLDEGVPWPVNSDMLEAARLIPSIKTFSNYRLKISDLSKGQYLLLMNGKEVAKVTAVQLSDGVDLAMLPNTPVARQGARILKLINDLQGRAVLTYRKANKAGEALKTKHAGQWINKVESQLKLAIQPKSICIEVKRVGQVH